MQRHVERLAALDQDAVEDALDPVGALQHGHAVAQGMDRLGLEDGVEPLAYDGPGRGAGEDLQIVGSPLDLPGIRDRQQKADRLDRAQQMDGFPVAVVEVDRIVEGGRHAAAAPAASWKQRKTERAERTAASIWSLSIRRASRRATSERQRRPVPSGSRNRRGAS